MNYDKKYWVEQAYEQVAENVEITPAVLDENGEVVTPAVTEEKMVTRLKTTINEISSKAIALSGRPWREFICRYLANELLEKLDGKEDSLTQFVSVLVLLDYGMAWTASKVVKSLSLPAELADIKSWLLEQLKVIYEEK